MIDFALTKTGDIILSESQRKKETRRLYFNVSNSSTSQVSFYIDDTPTKQTKNKIIISFEVNNNIEGEHDFHTINGKDSLKQMIYNIIYTSKNELKIKKDFGSRMEEVKHHPIFDEKTISKAREYVKNSLYDILPNANVEVYPDYSTKPKFKQGLRIIVTNRSTELFNEII